jgi:hypothetical protein
MKARGRRGYQSTVLTGPGGVTLRAPLNRPTLLGSTDLGGKTGMLGG